MKLVFICYLSWCAPLLTTCILWKIIDPRSLCALAVTFNWIWQPSKNLPNRQIKKKKKPHRSFLLYISSTVHEINCAIYISYIPSWRFLLVLFHIQHCQMRWREHSWWWGNCCIRHHQYRLWALESKQHSQVWLPREYPGFSIVWFKHCDMSFSFNTIVHISVEIFIVKNTS